MKNGKWRMESGTCRKMKDSGIEWLGEVPEGWSVDRIASLYTHRNEKVSDRDYAPLSVTMKGILPQLETAAKTDDGDNRKRVCKGDFAINSRSDRRGACGISSYEGSVSLINTILSPRESMDPGYYNWLFHTASFADEYYKWGHGIVDDLWTTRWSEMKRISIVRPPLPEQQKIAVYLDRACAKIDETIAGTKQTIEEHKAWKASLIFEAVTGKCRIENGKCRMGGRKMRDSGIPWLGKVPCEYRVLKFKYVLTRNDGGVWGDDPSGNDRDKIVLRSTEQNVDGTWNIVNPAVRDLNSVPHLEYWIVEEGDLLLTKSSGSELHIGKTTIADSEIASMKCYYSNFMQRLRVKKFMMVDRFAWYILNSSIARGQFVYQQNSTSGIGNINAQNINSLIVPVPSIQEQEVVVAYLDKKCAAIDRVIAEKEALIADLEAYRKSLIFEVVTGKMAVA